MTVRSGRKSGSPISSSSGVRRSRHRRMLTLACQQVSSQKEKEKWETRQRRNSRSSHKPRKQKRSREIQYRSTKGKEKQ